MLEILGTIGGNALSLPGFLGVSLGMMTQRLWLAAIMGGFVGLCQSLMLSHWDFATVNVTELAIAMIIGVLAGCVGCAIRLKGVLAR